MLRTLPRHVATFRKADSCGASVVCRTYARAATEDTEVIEETADDPGLAKTPLTGLLAKHAVLEQNIQRRISALKARATRLRRLQEAEDAKNSPALPPRALPSAYNPHHDVDSYLEYAKQVNLKSTTTVYKGTLYEYTVVDALKAYGMSLKRIGKSNDYGIDLLGHWSLPQTGTALRVLVQCKMSKPLPALIRELEGSYSGAPSGWQGDDVLALLASRHAASPGAQKAVQRSKLPIGFVQVDTDRVIKQFIWNDAANQCGLTGIGVTFKYSVGDEQSSTDDKVASSIALTWLGGQWPEACMPGDHGERGDESA